MIFRFFLLESSSIWFVTFNAFSLFLDNNFLSVISVDNTKAGSLEHI